jgi:outer membrane protein
MLSGSPCSADTLADAVRLAYENNPTLRAQRAELQATNETLVQAEAAFGPQIGLTGNVSAEAARVATGPVLFGAGGSTTYTGGTTSTTLSAVQPLYSSGALRAQRAAASADVDLGRQQLRGVEAKVVYQVIAAYLDVRRDRASLKLIEDEIAALVRIDDEARAKGKLGQITRTDVAQASARLVAAQLQYATVQGRLRQSEAEYLNVVGENPAALEPEPALSDVPESVDDAFDIASFESPQLLAAAARELENREKVNAAKAALGPNLSVHIDATVAPTQPYLQHSYEKSAAVSLVYSQPLFMAGANRSKIRQAVAEDNRAMLEVEAARRDVVQSVSQAWSRMTTAANGSRLLTRQVAAQQEVVTGDRIEQRVGQRSTIELLNAELELTEAQLSLAQIRHDEYLAKAELLFSMGRLSAGLIVSDLRLEDPGRGLRRVRGRTFGPLTPLIGAAEAVAGPRTPQPEPSAPPAGFLRPAVVPADAPQ